MFFLKVHMPLPSNQGLLSPAGLNQSELKALTLSYMGHCKAMLKNLRPTSKARAVGICCMTQGTHTGAL